MKKLFLFFLITNTFFVSAQIQKKNQSVLTIDKIMQDPKTWIGTSPDNFVWAEQSDRVFFDWNPEKDTLSSLYLYHLKTKETSKVAVEEKLKLPIGSGDYNAGKTKKVFVRNGNLFLLDIKNGTEKKLTYWLERASSPKFVLNDSEISFVKNNNLFTIHPETGLIKQITNFVEGEEKPDPKKTAQDEWLEKQQAVLFDVLKQREAMDKAKEFQQEKEKTVQPEKIYLGKKRLGNAVLSPTGKYVVYTTFNSSQGNKSTSVTHFVTESGYTEEKTARTKVGNAQNQVEMGIFDVEYNKTIKIKTGEIPGLKDFPEYLSEYPERLPKDSTEIKDRAINLTGPVWNETRDLAIVVALAHDNKDRWILLLDAATGNLETLDRQHDDAWVGGPGIGGWGMSAGSVGWMPDEKSVWFHSEESGYSHLYTVNNETKVKKALTSGNFEVSDAFISNDKKWYYFTANKIHPGVSHFYRMPVWGGEPIQITSMEGGNEITLSPDESTLAIRYSTANQPWELYVQENKPGAVATKITRSTTTEFEKYPWRVPEFVAFKTDDGATVYARLCGRGAAGAAPTAAEATAPAADLLMRRMATGEQRFLAQVAAYEFDDAGTLMAYVVRGQQRLGNGVYVMTLATGEQRTLDAAAADYDALAWSEKGTNLAVIRGEKPRGKAQRENVVLTWRGVGAADVRAATLEPAKAASFPAGMVVSEFTTPRWSTDGERLLLGLKAQEDEKPEADEPQANVDVWHWKDDDPQSVQTVQLNNARRATRAAILDLASGALRPIADDRITSITASDDLRWALGRDETPYAGEVAWGGSRSDIYRVNLTTGDRTLIERGLTRTMGLSPDGKYALYLKAGRVHAYDMAGGKSTVIDGGRNFVNVDDDHDYEKPVYGFAGFTTDGKALVYDRHDVWALPLAGGPLANLTKGDGAKRSVRYRVVQLGAGGGGRGGGRGGGPAQEPIDLGKPVLLSAFGEWTKESGYAELAPGGSPSPLIWADKSIGAPMAAKNADRVVFTQQTFNEFPNYWTADKRFANPKQVTDAAPELFKDFAWGTRKLVDYKNSKGQRLQGTLTLPAGYEPGRKYPMIVYFYEKMSDTHHNFSFPVYDDRPHMSTYSSNGYLVLQPDVVYEIGKPGTSALDCVTSAVKKVIELGYADPARIGLQGHSWGGYQSSFIVTQTNMFAAVVTGAPPTNLTSFVGTLYRSSGTIQQGITEVGQVRMGKDTTPWSAHELYESQSPVHNAPKITTPFMILHGTADGSVDHSQGLEFYAAARRLGKQVILLSYPDEGHHLGRRENQKDFQIRMRQYFDHYLKGAPAPLWMTEGVPQLKKGMDPLIVAPSAPKKTDRE